MPKVVINTNYAGLEGALSPKAIAAYYARKGLKVWFYRDPANEELPDSGDETLVRAEPETIVFDPWFNILFVYPCDHGPSLPTSPPGWLDLDDIPRDDPDLVAALEELGDEAAWGDAKLKVLEVPDDVDWRIGRSDWGEWVEEVHRVWR